MSIHFHAPGFLVCMRGGRGYFGLRQQAGSSEVRHLRYIMEHTARWPSGFRIAAAAPGRVAGDPRRLNTIAAIQS